MLANLTRLKLLDLHFNKIELVDRNAFERNSDLQLLDLSKNRLKSLAFDLNMNKLVSLNLNENDISKIANGALFNIVSLKILLVEKNQLDELNPSQFSKLTKLKVLKLNNNKLEAADLERLTLSLALNLLTLNVSYNNIKSIESSNSNGSSFNNQKIILQSLVFNSNKISEIKPFSFACFSSLKSLGLSMQRIVNLSSPDIFSGLGNLKNLCLKKNSLTRIYNKTFSRCTILSSLDLSSNKLDQLDQEAFQNLANLNELILSDNNLQTLISYQFTDSARLSVIDLGQNNLNIIQPLGFFGLEKSLKTLRLGSKQHIV
jgi:Leucine-rich repeat (LRR) protein